MTIMLIGAVQAFFLTLLLWKKKERNLPDVLLMFWLIIAGFHLLFYYDNFSATPLANRPFHILGFSLSMLSAPLMFLYIYSLTNNQELQRGWYFHFLPYLIYNAIIFYYFLGDESSVRVRNGFISLGENAPRWLRHYLGIPLAISGGVYAAWSLIILRKYQKRLPDFFSFTEKVNLNWLKYLVIAAIAFFVFIYVIIQFGSSSAWIAHERIFLLVSAVLTAYLFFVGYMGLRQISIFVSFPEPSKMASVSSPTSKNKTEENATDPPQKKAYQKSSLDKATSELILRNLKKYMKNEQAYLDESLSLSKLAEQIDCTSNQLSQVINQETQSNFFTFVNTYRIEAVKVKLKDSKFDHYTILAIAFDCGFKSKASFNKIFKSVVGMTPSQFRKA